ncbi:MAG: hypothetical protein KN64_13310 [Sulfurovum sp. AS07-7]|nr:MAG: hypothetical protein KN64_13310 [Sulfurovum sp. AS07-7]
MKNLFEIIAGKPLATLIVIALVAKLIWFVVALLWLKQDDVQTVVPSNTSALFYTIKFQNSQATQNISSIKLLGLYCSDETIVATIENSGKTEILSKGEEVNGYKLVSAGSDWIKLANGTNEMLLKLENAQETTSQANITSQTTMTNATPQPIPSAPTMNTGSQSISNTMQDEEEDGMKEYRNSKNELSDVVVTDVYNGSLQQKIGLQKDDSIREINGKPVSKMVDINDVYNQLSSNKSIKVKIIRDGKERELSYEVH